MTQLNLNAGGSLRMKDSATGADYIDWTDADPLPGDVIRFRKSRGDFDVKVLKILGPRYVVVEFLNGWEA